MKRAFYVNALAMADRHIAQGNRIIASQRRLIARLDAGCHDPTDAKTLLVTFLNCQQLHQDDRHRFISELAKCGNE